MYYCHLQLYTCTRERVREGDTEIEEREREMLSHMTSCILIMIVLVQCLHTCNVAKHSNIHYFILKSPWEGNIPFFS